MTMTPMQEEARHEEFESCLGYKVDPIKKRIAMSLGSGSIYILYLS